VARSPELWLLDEPHAGLDAEARVLLGQLVTEASTGGATVVIASHEANLVEPLADRAVTITGGRMTGERTLRDPAGQPMPTGDPVPARELMPTGDPVPAPLPDADPTPDVERAIHVA
jgi:ABC-type multidrug transport system ATPase subunit